MQPNIADLPPRIASKIDHRPDPETGCWVWIAAIGTHGYGVVRFAGKACLSHRVIFELLVSPIPEGMIIDHRCFNHACVNPNHLRLVTQKQNLEHRLGPQSGTKSGLRGVCWDASGNKWFVVVKHHGKNRYGGRFNSKDEAAQAAIALRAKLFTHDDGKMT